MIARVDQRLPTEVGTGGTQTWARYEVETPVRRAPNCPGDQPSRCRREHWVSWAATARLNHRIALESRHRRHWAKRARSHYGALVDAEATAPVHSLRRGARASTRCLRGNSRCGLLQSSS